MHGLICDRCGKNLLIEEAVRYVVDIRVKAAYDPLELTREDLERDLEAERRKLLERLEKMDAREAQEQVYVELHFDLCPPCQKEYLHAPLGERIEEQGEATD